MAGQGRAGARHHLLRTHRRAPSIDGTGGDSGDVELGTRQQQHGHASRGAEEEAQQREALLGADQSAPPGSDRGGGEIGLHGGGKGEAHPLRPISSFKAKGPLAAWLDSLSPRLKFAILVGCVMVFFGLHNILQEKLFAMEGFNFGWSLGMLEAVGVLAGSMVERAHLSERKKRVAPFHNYVLLAGLLGMSSSLSNIALNYIKYPTKVIFRSCKLIPTMAIAVIWRKKIVSRGEFLAAFAVCTGLIVFAQADAKLEPDFHPKGIAMVILSVCADAFLPNLQEHVFSMGASRVEVTFFTNSLTVLGMLLSTTANGNLLEFLRYAVQSRSAMAHMVAYAILSHVAIAAHMMVLKEYGGVTAVLVGVTRKSMTIALSFILFPKPFSYHFVLGGALVLGGLAANVRIKDRRKGAGAANKSHANLLAAKDNNGGSGSGVGSSGNGTSNGSIKLGNRLVADHHHGSDSESASGMAPSGGGGSGAPGGGRGGSSGGPVGSSTSGSGKHPRHRRDDGESGNGHGGVSFAPTKR